MTTREKITRLARECGAYVYQNQPNDIIFDRGKGIEAFYHAVRNEALEEAAKVCDLQQSEHECPERATYCAEAIRKLKETK